MELWTNISNTHTHTLKIGIDFLVWNRNVNKVYINDQMIDLNRKHVKIKVNFVCYCGGVNGSQFVRFICCCSDGGVWLAVICCVEFCCVCCCDDCCDCADLSMIGVTTDVRLPLHSSVIKISGDGFDWLLYAVLLPGDSELCSIFESGWIALSGTCCAYEELKKAKNVHQFFKWSASENRSILLGVQQAIFGVLPQVTNDRNVFGCLVMVAILKHAIITARMPCWSITEIC